MAFLIEKAARTVSIVLLKLDVGFAAGPSNIGQISLTCGGSPGATRSDGLPGLAQRKFQQNSRRSRSSLCTLC